MRVVKEMRRTKEANLVVPLDEVRTIDYGVLTYKSGYPATSGIIYTIASGKEAYLRQLIISELSGNAGTIQIVDGDEKPITPHLKLVGGQTKIINTCIGPVTDKFVVASGSPICADITLVVQIDPKYME